MPANKPTPAKGFIPTSRPEAREALKRKILQTMAAPGMSTGMAEEIVPRPEYNPETDTRLRAYYKGGAWRDQATMQEVNPENETYQYTGPMADELTGRPKLSHSQNLVGQYASKKKK